MWTFCSMTGIYRWITLLEPKDLGTMDKKLLYLKFLEQKWIMTSTTNLITLSPCLKLNYLCEWLSSCKLFSLIILNSIICQYY